MYVKVYTYENMNVSFKSSKEANIHKLFRIKIENCILLYFTLLCLF